MRKINNNEFINKKGYSLIELIAVIALIALILLLFAPKVVGIVSEFSDNRFKELVMRNAESAAKNYVSDNKYENVIANEIKDQCNIYGNSSAIIKIKIKIKELINNNYLEATKAIKKGIIDEESDVIEIEYNCGTKKFISYKYGESTIKSIDLTYPDTNAEFEVTSSSIIGYYTVIMKEETTDHIDLNKSSCFATLKNSSSDPINGNLELDPRDNTSNNYKCTINALKNDTDYDISVNFVTNNGFSKERIDPKKTLNITAPSYEMLDKDCTNTSMMYNILYDKIFYNKIDSINNNTRDEINLSYYFQVVDGSENLLVQNGSTILKCGSGVDGYLNCSSELITNLTNLEEGFWYKIDSSSFTSTVDDEFYLYKIYVRGEVIIRSLIYDGTNTVGDANSSLNVNTDDYTNYYNDYKVHFNLDNKKTFTNRIEIQFTKPVISNSCIYNYSGTIDPSTEKQVSNYSNINGKDMMVYDWLEDNKSYKLGVCVNETEICDTIALSTNDLKEGFIKSNYLSKIYNPGTLLTAKLEFSNINDGSLYSRDENYVMITDSSNNTITKYAGNQLLNQQFQLSSSIDTKLQFTLFDGVNLATSGFDIWFGKNQELDGNPIIYTNTIIAKYKKNSDYEHITKGECFYALGTDFSNALEGSYDINSNTCTFTKLTQNTIYNIKLVTTFDDGATKDSITNGVATKSVVATTINNSNYIEYPITNMYNSTLQERYIKLDIDYTLSNNTSLADCGKGENPTNCSQYSSISNVSANTWYKINSSTIFSEKDSYVGTIETINSDITNQVKTVYYLETKESSSKVKHTLTNSNIDTYIKDYNINRPPVDYVLVDSNSCEGCSWNGYDSKTIYNLTGGAIIKYYFFVTNFLKSINYEDYEIIKEEFSYGVVLGGFGSDCITPSWSSQKRSCIFGINELYNTSMINIITGIDATLYGSSGSYSSQYKIPVTPHSFVTYPNISNISPKDIDVVQLEFPISTTNSNTKGYVRVENAKLDITVLGYKNYSAVTSSGSNGTITPSGTKTLSNGNSAGQYINIIPNTGYKVSNVIVNETSIGDVNKVYIYRLTKDYIISATFEKIS